MDKLRRHFGEVLLIFYNAAYHSPGRVRRHLEENSDFVRRIFLPPYSPFLNPAEHLWRVGKARLCRTFRRPAKSYFRRNVCSCTSRLG